MNKLINIDFFFNQILASDEYKFLQYVSVIVQLFIVISISVSFMTMGSALHHTSKIHHTCILANIYLFSLLVKGVVDSFWNPVLEVETSLTKYGSIFQYITVRR